MNEPHAQPVAASSADADAETASHAPVSSAAVAVPRKRAAALGAVTTLVALTGLCVAWEWWLAPLRPGGSALVLKAVPLLLALPGVWRRSVYTLQWASMLILLYFTEGVVRGWSEHGSGAVLGWLEALLAVVFFICALAYVAPFKRAAKLAARRAAKHATEQADMQFADLAANRATHRAGEQAARQAVGEAGNQTAAGEAANQAAGEAANHAAGEAANEAVDEAAKQTAGQATNQAAAEVPNQATSEAPNRAANKANPTG